MVNSRTWLGSASLMANFGNLADFVKISIGAPPRPPGGQFVLSVWERPMAVN